MKQIVIIKSGAISGADKKRLEKAGYMVIESPNPKDISFAPKLTPVSQAEVKGFFSPQIKAIMTSIVEIVADCSSIESGMLFEKTRKTEVVSARQLAIFFIRERHPEFSFKLIGRFFGIDHSTVIHSIQAVTDHYDTELQTKAMVNKIRLQLSQPKESAETI